MKAAILAAAYLFCLPIVSAAKDKAAPEPVKVYCFSEDLEAGFKDKVAEYVCKELGKRGEKKGSLVLVESREQAQAVVQFLGTEAISVEGETTYLMGGYAWTPDQLKTGARTLLTIKDYAKGFHARGRGGQATAGVAAKTEKWIRDNQDNILAKSK